MLVGYAQWPSREVWAEQHTFSNEQFVLGRKNMRDCIASSKTVYEMEVKDDYLQHS
ncbi:hypothetical protein [Psychromonas sp. B3M02]|uniref:hypothetical protein n=1 Tax=Psychromonas sp. B3M02 TaxID=2267226 RepID=UPI0015EFF9FC|nr:hypothetical protein [Psychromonas sp. B3M02]